MKYEEALPLSKPKNTKGDNPGLIPSVQAHSWIRKRYARRRSWPAGHRLEYRTRRPPHPHFLGLHALQLLPLFAWLTRKRKRPTALVIVAALSYFGMMLLLTWQALRGESLVQPDPATLAVLIVWAVASAGALGFTQLPFPALRRQTASAS